VVQADLLLPTYDSVRAWKPGGGHVDTAVVVGSCGLVILEFCVNWLNVLLIVTRLEKI